MLRKRCYAKTSCCSANVFISIFNLQTGCLVDLPTPVENPARLRTHQFYIPQQPAEGKVFGIHKCVLVIALVNMLVHSAAKFTHPALHSRKKNILLLAPVPLILKKDNVLLSHIHTGFGSDRL